LKERRKEERAHLSGWVELSVDGRQRRRATTEDVSVDGLGILLDGDPLAAGSRAIAEFPLPGIGLPLALSAEVVWVGTDRAGLRFEDVDPGLRELVESFVAGKLAE
jgi:c-di-GMP-binding flagellar brake protein YcgR